MYLHELRYNEMHYLCENIPKKDFEGKEEKRTLAASSPCFSGTHWVRTRRTTLLTRASDGGPELKISAVHTMEQTLTAAAPTQSALCTLEFFFCYLSLSSSHPTSEQSVQIQHKSSGSSAKTLMSFHLPWQMHRHPGSQWNMAASDKARKTPTRSTSPSTGPCARTQQSVLQVPANCTTNPNLPASGYAPEVVKQGTCKGHTADQLMITAYHAERGTTFYCHRRRF